MKKSLVKLVENPLLGNQTPHLRGTTSETEKEGEGPQSNFDRLVTQNQIRAETPGYGIGRLLRGVWDLLFSEKPKDISPTSIKIKSAKKGEGKDKKLLLRGPDRYETISAAEVVMFDTRSFASLEELEKTIQDQKGNFSEAVILAHGRRVYSAKAPLAKVVATPNMWMMDKDQYTTIEQIITMINHNNPNPPKTIHLQACYIGAGINDLMKQEYITLETADFTLFEDPKKNHYNFLLKNALAEDQCAIFYGGNDLNYGGTDLPSFEGRYQITSLLRDIKTEIHYVIKRNGELDVFSYKPVAAEINQMGNPGDDPAEKLRLFFKKSLHEFSDFKKRNNLNDERDEIRSPDELVNDFSRDQLLRYFRDKIILDASHSHDNPNHQNDLRENKKLFNAKNDFAFEILLTADLSAARVSDYRSLAEYLIDEVGITAVKGLNVRDQNFQGKTLLNQAISNTGHFASAGAYMTKSKLVSLFLKLGSDPSIKDQDGVNALMNAAADKKLVEMLLKYPRIDLHEKDNNQCSVLMHAIKSRNTESQHRLSSIEFLIKLGIDLNWQDTNGNTALIYALPDTLSGDIREREKIVKILVNSGIDISKKNKDGRTAIIHFAGFYEARKTTPEYAARFPKLAKDSLAIEEESQKTILELLINSGADIYQKDNFGKNALNYAQERSPQLAEFLLQKTSEYEIKKSQGFFDKEGDKEDINATSNILKTAVVGTSILLSGAAVAIHLSQVKGKDGQKGI